MNKYIDAELLKAEIEKNTPDRFELLVYRDIILALITSLQQEPKVDLVTELKHHLATTPKEQLEKEWKELEPWSNIGPTVQEFLYGKQPDVDLKKLGEVARHIIAVKQNVEDMRLSEDEWLLLERIGYPQKLNARNEDQGKC